MATLRLFANLRESAGVDRIDIEAPTVGELLRKANDQFGERFTESAALAGVWLNGDPVDMTATLAASDEVALIPPVSGGALAAPPSVSVIPNLLSVALVVALLAVAWADEAWFAVVAVGAILAWVWDLSETSLRIREPFVVYPPLIGAALGGVGAFAWGFEGYAGAVALAIIVAVSWPVFDSAHREFRITAATTLVTVIAVGGSAALILIRLTGSYAVVAFVLITAIALIGAWGAGAYGESIQSVDANVGALLGALLAGFFAGWIIVELDYSAGLLGGVAAAAGVIAGRTLGSALRTGAIVHTEEHPGTLSMFDGAVIAAPLFWIAIWTFS